MVSSITSHFKHWKTFHDIKDFKLWTLNLKLFLSAKKRICKLFQ
jgi:hypothetical protein